MSESNEQIAVFAWATFNTARLPELALLFHVPNGGVGRKSPPPASRRRACEPVSRTSGYPSPGSAITAWSSS